MEYSSLDKQILKENYWMYFIPPTEPKDEFDEWYKEYMEHCGTTTMEVHMKAAWQKARETK